MSDDPRADVPSVRTGTPISQILVFFAALLVLLGVLILSQNGVERIPVTPTPAPVTRVYFAQPEDGATVPATFTVLMGAEGLLVEPAGEIHPGAGHYHILVNTDFIAPGEVIPRDDAHLHFGNGASEAELTLPPGTHTLRLQVGDGAHTALEGTQYLDEITVTVE